MNLFRYELYKIICRKSLWMMAFLVLVFTGLSVLQWIANGRGHANSYSVYAPYEGPVTEAKQDAFNEFQQQHPQPAQFTDFTKTDYDLMTLNWTMQTLNQESQQYVSDIKALENEVNTTSGYAQRQAQAELSAMRRVGPPALHYTRAWDRMSDFYRFIGIAVMCVMILLGVSHVFSNEHTTGVHQYILSAKRGRRTVVTAKLLAVGVYVSAVAVLFGAFNFVLNVSLFGWHGWNAPLRDQFNNIYGYQATPYPWLVWQHAVIQFLVFLLGSLSFSALVSYLSAKTKSTLASMTSAAAVFALPVLLHDVFQVNIKYITTLLGFTYSPVVSTVSLFDSFHVYDVFGNPVSYAVLAVGVMVVSFWLFVYLTYHAIRREQITAS